VYDNDQEVDKIETVVTGIPVENEDLFMKFLENLNGTTKRILGTSLAIFSGILYAFTFTPALYIQDNSDKFPGASDDALDYVFSLYTGIYISSISYFIIYCMIKKNKPNIQPEVTYIDGCVINNLIKHSRVIFILGSIASSDQWWNVGHRQ